ncbi:CoA transferase [Paralcaligenes sp. KSB-10]|uniref:CaiB/BaiF CoA transferase family protein n=1 Tax=Paralcaligenes sp. KSB-10 TaxID=2901142 RepID=UPI001E53D0B8|nr:CoA transferase [Paralcaligenes sp. KSB-10]UHL62952.1 CoA transferase [Paralcaligenes sp. KSB-10]
MPRLELRGSIDPINRIAALKNLGVFAFFHGNWNLSDTMAILSNITILDLSRVFAAPLATQMLSDLGARIWKVESFRGDDSRKWGSHVFNAFNRGKKSLALNLKDVRAQQILQRLSSKADVFVENFKTGDLDRYGLSYETLSGLNERLVYLSLTGFGHTGPYRHQPGYDTIIQAMSGVMSVTGDPDGPPTRVGIAWVDVMSGLVSAIGILAALQERERSGKGQHIDLSLFDVGMMALIDVAQDYIQNDNIQRRTGNVTRNLSPAQVFKASDGWLVIAVGNDDQFRRFCQVIGCPGLAEDERFKSNLDRVAHRSALSEVLIPVISGRSRDHWVAVLHESKIPVSPVLDVDEAIQSPQAIERGATWEVPGKNGDLLALMANPLRHMSRTPARPSGAPPLLGEHTSEVLHHELGLSSDDIDVLIAEGVVLPTD